MNEVEEVRQRLDIVDLISQYLTLKKAGANYKGVCPFHQEKTPSLMVSPQKQIWKCFGCGKGGDAFSFVMEAEHLEFGDALRLLAQKAGVTLKPRTQAEHQSQTRKDSLYRINELASKIFEKILWEAADGKTALNYLKKRGLDEKTIRKFRLGYASRKISAKDLMLKKGVPAAELAKAGSPEKFFERVIFPIFDVMGHVIGFTGRTLGDSQPKYLNSPETPLFNKSRILYGLNFAKGAIKDSDAVVLVEGQFDVIALHHHGIENAVASSGTAITEQQLQILSKYTPNFLLAFDGDTAGINTTKKVIELLLAADLNARVINFGKFKDADELLMNDSEGFTSSAVERWVIQQKAAKEAIDWLIDQAIAEAGDIKQIEGKKKVLKAVLSIVKLIDDPTRLDHAAQRLASKLGLSLDSIYSSIARAKSPKQSGDSAGNRPGKASLTNEEQLLAIFLSKPQLIKDFIGKLKNIVWLSVDARSIADVLENCYTNKALVTNQNQFLSQVKNQTNSQIAQKVDAWMFWLSDQWNNLTDPTAIELLEEKFRLLSNKSHENQKTQLAQSIKTAQEAGDVKEIKKLMNKLNELTKEA
ncbi:MAG: DNA primase [Patescibacteria group bacterium]